MHIVCEVRRWVSSDFLSVAKWMYRICLLTCFVAGIPLLYFFTISSFRNTDVDEVAAMLSGEYVSEYRYCAFI